VHVTGAQIEVGHHNLLTLGHEYPTFFQVLGSCRRVPLKIGKPTTGCLSRGMVRRYDSGVWFGVWFGGMVRGYCSGCGKSMFHVTNELCDGPCGDLKTIINPLCHA
jgi:hypothetical protein